MPRYLKLLFPLTFALFGCEGLDSTFPLESDFQADGNSNFFEYAQLEINENRGFIESKTNAPYLVVAMMQEQSNPFKGNLTVYFPKDNQHQTCYENHNHGTQRQCPSVGLEDRQHLGFKIREGTDPNIASSCIAPKTCDFSQYGGKDVFTPPSETNGVFNHDLIKKKDYLVLIETPREFGKQATHFEIK